MLSLVSWSWVFGLFGLLVAVLIYQWIAKQPNGTELMQKIESYIFHGAMAFLKRQYSTLAIFVVIVFFLLVFGINWQTALYAGYGDDRALDEHDDLRRTSRQLFAKISYAFQR